MRQGLHLVCGQLISEAPAQRGHKCLRLLPLRFPEQQLRCSNVPPSAHPQRLNCSRLAVLIASYRSRPLDLLVPLIAHFSSKHRINRDRRLSASLDYRVHNLSLGLARGLLLPVNNRMKVGSRAIRPSRLLVVNARPFSRIGDSRAVLDICLNSSSSLRLR